MEERQWAGREVGGEEWVAEGREVGGGEWVGKGRGTKHIVRKGPPSSPHTGRVATLPHHDATHAVCWHREHAISIPRPPLQKTENPFPQNSV